MDRAPPAGAPQADEANWAFVRPLHASSRWPGRAAGLKPFGTNTLSRRCKEFDTVDARSAAERPCLIRPLTDCPAA
jgi:hypothetical protein